VLYLTIWEWIYSYLVRNRQIDIALEDDTLQNAQDSYQASRALQCGLPWQQETTEAKLKAIFGRFFQMQNSGKKEEKRPTIDPEFQILRSAFSCQDNG
jgi:hypothetical protein